MELYFNAEIKKLGNSSAIIIPADIMADLKLKKGDKVNAVVSNPKTGHKLE